MKNAGSLEFKQVKACLPARWNKRAVATLAMMLLLSGCAKSDPKLELVAIQHMGEGLIDGDACKTLRREDGLNIETPQNFTVSPYELIVIAKETLGYSCGHKWGAQIYADKENYYIVRLGLIEDAIIISGETGAILSKGFMEKPE